MVTNILQALLNIQKYGSNALNKIVVVTNPSRPRVNVTGDKLDGYVKDSFCDTFDITDPSDKMEGYMKELSHPGSQNNPPDMMIRGGDAIEVKKVEGFGTSAIALNSSPPKQKLLSDDSMITFSCRGCEEWDEKDLIYCVGNIDKGYVRILSFIYGDCYAAKKEHYEEIKKSMIEGIEGLDIELASTKELARLNKVDPLKITDLRVRGMFQIKPPLVVFSEFIKTCPDKDLCVYAIMKSEKFESFPNGDKNKVLEKMDVKDIKIKDPDNPEQEMNAKLITFSF